MIRQSVVVLAVLATSSVPVSGQTVSTKAPHAHHEQDSATDLTALFPTRDASGTAWAPVLTPMFGAMRQWGGWGVMLHGSAFGQLIAEPGDRHRTGGASTHQVSSVNWGTPMARRPLAGGRVGLRAMGSAQAWTARDCGFLNLANTGLR
jgi:hypothetical protein